MAKKKLIRRSKSNIALLKKIILENPDLSYGDFCKMWLDLGRSKASTPKRKSFYNTRSYMKLHGPPSDAGHGTTEKTRARYVDQAQVEKGFKARRTRTNKVKARGYLEIEELLENIISKARALQNNGLAEKLKEARRIAGAEIIHV